MGGLLMVPDRSAAVAAMEAELSEPEGAVTTEFIRDLASLAVDRRRSSQAAAEGAYLALVEHYAAVRARVLDVRPGRLEAAWLEDLREGGRFESRFYRGVLGPVAHRYPRQVMSAFRRLTVHEQRSLLTVSWRRFAERAFVPLVRRLALAPPADNDGLRDIALRRWYELAPRAAAMALRRELRRSRPRVSIDTLALLPDRATPELQRTWLLGLSTSGDDASHASAAERLERFGTRWGAAGAARAWEARRDSWTIEASAATLAYLIRVDSSTGLSLLRQALDESVPTRSLDGYRQEGGFLWQVGSREWHPTLETIAIDALAHRDGAVRRDAARLLQEYGSPAARGPVETSLALAIAAVEPTANRYPVLGSRDADDPDRMLRSLGSALAKAQSWTLRQVDIEAWAGRCPTHECREAFWSGDRRRGRSGIILVHVPAPGRERDQRFSVDGVRIDGERALIAKLSQYPRGSRFRWMDADAAPFAQERERWTGEERRRLFDRISRRSRSVGIEVDRGVR